MTTAAHRGDGVPDVGRPPGPAGFGPSALLTPANLITGIRLAFAPVIVLLVGVRGATWAAFGLVALVAATDSLDGWVARRQGTTTSGAFLDPLADKALVLGALTALSVRGAIPWVPVLVIALRELAMVGYRMVLSRSGVSVPARPSAKVKTLVQVAVVGLCLMPPLAAHHVVLAVALWAAAALTVVTGAQYLVDARRAARGATSGGPAPRPAAGSGPG